MPTITFKRSCYVLFLAYNLAVLFTFVSIYYRSYSHTQDVVRADGEEIGGDFLCFYVAGKIATEYPERLYDFGFQAMQQKMLFDGTSAHFGALPFAYPPLVAAFFSLFANLTLANAYFVWTLFSIALIGLGYGMLGWHFRWTLGERVYLFISCFAFVPFLLDCLGGGQTSAVGFVIYTAVFLLFAQKQEFWAGVVLGFSYYKPPLFVFFSLITLITGHWRAVVGALLSGVCLFGTSVAWLGWAEFLKYLGAIQSYTYGKELLPGVSIPTSKGIGLFALLNEYLGVNIYTKGFFAILLAMVVVFVSYVSKPLFNAGKQQLCFALWVSLSLLFSIQLVIYDLSILLLPFMLFYEHIKNKLFTWSSILPIICLLGFYSEWIIRGEPQQFNVARLSLVIWCSSLFFCIYEETRKGT